MVNSGCRPASTRQRGSSEIRPLMAGCDGSHGLRTRTSRVCSGKAYLVDTRRRGQTPAQLRSLVADLAATPELWADEVRFDLTERYFSRLRLTDDYEVWLICWDIGQDTLLHDHGGSAR